MAANNKSRAKVMQEASTLESTERRIRVTIIDTKAFEYHLNPYESVVRGILDPDVADAFIEVPIDAPLKGAVLHAYLHTSQVAKLYLHDELSPEETPPANEKRGG